MKRETQQEIRQHRFHNIYISSLSICRTHRRKEDSARVHLEMSKTMTKTHTQRQIQGQIQRQNIQEERLPVYIYI